MMRIIKTVKEMKAVSSRIRKEGRIIGFVPTMGALHEGHLSLIKEARRVSDVVAVSIFVNPTQFGPEEDYKGYPREPEGDRKQCKEAGVDLLFVPSVEEMYPHGFLTSVTVAGITDVLCGPLRPGHFRGVTTIVATLFHVMQPQKIFLGQKDYQQAVVIKRMVEDLNMAVEIVVLPTVRETDGLAMSSRNSHLSHRERQAASVLFRALQTAHDMISKGERRASGVKEEMRKMIRTETLVKVEYLSLCHPETLQEVEGISGTVVIALAAWVGKTRLIDNIIVTAP